MSDNAAATAGDATAKPAAPEVAGENIVVGTEAAPADLKRGADQIDTDDGQSAKKVKPDDAAPTGAGAAAGDAAKDGSTPAAATETGQHQPSAICYARAHVHARHHAATSASRRQAGSRQAAAGRQCPPTTTSRVWAAVRS